MQKNLVLMGRAEKQPQVKSLELSDLTRYIGDSVIMPLTFDLQLLSGQQKAVAVMGISSVNVR